MQDPERLGHPGQRAARFHPPVPENGCVRGLQGVPAAVSADSSSPCSSHRIWAFVPDVIDD